MKHSLHLALLSVAVSAFSFSGVKAIDEVDGVFQIGTAADLTEFNALVTAGNDTAKAVLTADIDMSGVETTPIGKALPNEEGVHYRGTFDGQGHRIRNLVISNSDWEYMGLFGMLTDGAVIKNVIIDSSCSFSGKAFMGGIAGGSVGTGYVTIINCGNEATITGTNQNIAGIIGVAMGNTCPQIIIDCYNTGSISGANESAAITGWSGDPATVARCWNIGTVEGLDGANKLYRGGNVTSIGNYDIEGIQGIKFGEDSLTNGALTFMLNSSTFTQDQITALSTASKGATDYLFASAPDGITWFQNVDNGATADPQPVLDSTHGKVYMVGHLHCNGDQYEGMQYSNTEQVEKDAHDYIDGVCNYCDSVDYAWLTPTDSVYEIADAKQLNWLAHYVNKLTGEKVYARLTADIDFTEYTQQGVIIGLGGHDYTGWFDGQGHTITIDYPESLNAQYVALFRFLKAGTLKNLITEGSITTGQKFGAGMVGYIVGTESRIENCISKVNVTSTIEGDATNGGIAALTDGGGVYNSAFFGQLNGTASYGSSGIVGWSNNSAPMVRCLVNAQFNINVPGDGAGSNAIIARGSSAQESCYYLNENGGEVPEAGKALLATIDQLASGELTYMLNAYRSDSVSWYQNLDEGEIDETPLPFSNHAVVYAMGHLHCNSTPYEGEVTFSNTANSVIDSHDFVDGVCSYCETVQPDYLTPVNDYYELSTPVQLNWFARYVDAGNGHVNAKLLADIDFSEYTRKGVTIGQDQDEGTNYFFGTFDGQGHTITIDLIATREPQQYQASLFTVVDNGTIRNLKTSGSISGPARISGGIVGSMHNSLMENCISDVNISSTFVGDASLGGLTGDAQDHTIFRNCAFVGTLSAPEGVGNGGLSAYANGGTAVIYENCFVGGSFTTLGGEDDNSIMIARNNPTIKNCYYTDNGVLSIQDRTIEVTDEQVKSGELAFTLNGYKSGSGPWTQAVGTDAFPTPFGSNIVYATGTLKCDGTPDAVSYSNTEGELAIAQHSYDENGMCQNCGEMLISTGQQLFDFAESFNNSFVNDNVNVKLANDIDMAGIEGFQGIGTETVTFKGKFDGQGFRIKNLTIDGQDTDNHGLFACVGGDAEIRNVVIDTTCTIKGNAYIGGIAGASQGNGLVIFENCGNEATITATDVNAAGIVGVNMSSGAAFRIINCYNTGAINGARESAAISGWIGSSADVVSCFNIGEVTGVDGLQTFYRGTANLTNCYELAGIGQQIDSVTIAQVESGALCFMLNDSISGAEGPYYQTIGTDKHPQLFGQHGKVYELNGKYANTEITNSIKTATAGDKDGDVIVRIYSIDGVSLPALQKGVNIVRYKNGTVKKLYVK